VALLRRPPPQLRGVPQRVRGIEEWVHGRGLGGVVWGASRAPNYTIYFFPFGLGVGFFLAVAGIAGIGLTGAARVSGILNRSIFPVSVEISSRLAAPCCGTIERAIDLPSGERSGTGKEARSPFCSGVMPMAAASSLKRDFGLLSGAAKSRVGSSSFMSFGEW